jgi:hypothetical protein
MDVLLTDEFQESFLPLEQDQWPLTPMNEVNLLSQAELPDIQKRYQKLGVKENRVSTSEPTTNPSQSERAKLSFDTPETPQLARVNFQTLKPSSVPTSWLVPGQSYEQTQEGFSCFLGKTSENIDGNNLKPDLTHLDETGNVMEKPDVNLTAEAPQGPLDLVSKPPEIDRVNHPISDQAVTSADRPASEPNRVPSKNALLGDQLKQLSNHRFGNRNPSYLHKDEENMEALSDPIFLQSFGKKSYENVVLDTFRMHKVNYEKVDQLFDTHLEKYLDVHRSARVCGLMLRWLDLQRKQQRSMAELTRVGFQKLYQLSLGTKKNMLTALN